MTKNKNTIGGSAGESQPGKVSMIMELFESANLEPGKEPVFENKDYVYSSSHKMLLEGIDFDLVYTPLKHLGYKATLAVLGPLYATSFIPCAISVKVALSSRFGYSHIKELWSGVTAAVKEHDLQNIRLDLVPSITGLTLSLSSQGKQKREIFVQKPVCKPADLLCLSGGLGAAYMGLQILEREKLVFEKERSQPKLDNYKFVLQSYLNPFIDSSLFRVMNECGVIPSAGEFVVNGLADSVKSICFANSVGAKIFMNRIPIASELSAVSEEIKIDPFTAALNGGDDFRFLFAIPLDKLDTIKRELPQLDIIGHLCDPEAGALLITPDGKDLELKAQAWDK
jgi:thiamine-monophosphate kinase